MKILPLIFPAFLTLLAAVSYAGAEQQQATFSVGGCCRFPHPQRGIKEIQLNSLMERETAADIAACATLARTFLYALFPEEKVVQPDHTDYRPVLS